MPVLEVLVVLVVVVVIDFMVVVRALSGHICWPSEYIVVIRNKAPQGSVQLLLGKGRHDPVCDGKEATWIL